MIDWKNAAALIESQIPVSRLSKESYKERKAGSSQTLTGLGKWWVLCPSKFRERQAPTSQFHLEHL